MRKRSPLARISVLLGLGAATCLSAAAGCRRGNGYDPQGPLSVPADGNVRIVSRKIEQTPDRLHWKWSLIGERNWVEASATPEGMALAKTYPANSVRQGGGCNIWECDLVAERSGGTLRWTNTIHGSNGKTATAKGESPLPAGAASDSSVQIELDRDALERLSADVTLARVAGRPITLRVAR